MNTTVMNSFFLTRSLLGLALLAVVLTSCQDDPDQLITPEAEATATVSPEVEAKMDFIRETAGFSDEATIVYQDGEFTVDQRILISEEDTDQRMAAAGTSNTRTAQQRTDEYLVNPQQVRDIKVAFADEFDPLIEEDIFAEAINQWNNAGSALRFRVVPISSPYDVLVSRDDSITSSTLTSLPLIGGAPGSEIRINQSLFLQGSFSQDVRYAGFALGVTVGLVPLGQGTLIEGTPEEDPLSVMTDPILSVFPLLTEGDITAIRTLYPAGQSVSTLSVGESLDWGQALISENGRYRFAVQPDGNLVIYDTSESEPSELGQPIWSSQTNSDPRPQRVRLDVQEDGNIVLYNEDGSPRWATGTDGTPATRLVMQDDGNLVLYGDDGTPYWASQTAR